MLAALAAIIFFWPGSSGSGDVLIYADDGSGEQAFSLRGADMTPVESGVEQSVVVDTAHAGSDVYAVLRTVVFQTSGERVPVGMETNVYKLGSTPEQLTKDGTMKSQVAVAASGKYLVYTYANALLGSFLGAKPENQYLRLLDLETGETRELGQGMGAEFVGTDAGEFLVYASMKGVVVYNVAQRIPVVNSAVLTPEQSQSVRIARDGSHLAYRNPESGKWSLFKVQGLYPVLSLESVGQIEVSLMDAIATGDGLLGLTKNAEGSFELRSFADANSLVAGELMKEFRSDRLITRIGIN